MLNLKVGVMPGRLVEVIVEEGTTAREIFSIAGIEISNHEIRLDGEKIELNNVINEGRLLVAMKMIKGNLGRYVTNCTEQEVYHITGLALDTVIDESDVDELDDMLLIKDEYLIDRDIFLSIYVLDGDEEMDIEDELFDIKEVEETCDWTHVKAIDVIKEEIEETKKSIELFRNRISAYQDKLYVLEGLLEKIEG